MPTKIKFAYSSLVEKTIETKKGGKIKIDVLPLYNEDPKPLSVFIPDDLNDKIADAEEGSTITCYGHFYGRKYTTKFGEGCETRIVVDAVDIKAVNGKPLPF